MRVARVELKRYSIVIVEEKVTEAECIAQENRQFPTLVSVITELGQQFAVGNLFLRQESVT